LAQRPLDARGGSAVGERPAESTLRTLGTSSSHHRRTINRYNRDITFGYREPVETLGSRWLEFVRLRRVFSRRMLLDILNTASRTMEAVEMSLSQISFLYIISTECQTLKIRE
jgi:hypothetical protein